MRDFFPTFAEKAQGEKVLQNSNSPNKRWKKILTLQNELLRKPRSSYPLASYSACVVYTKTIIHLGVGESGGYLPPLRWIIVNYTKKDDLSLAVNTVTLEEPDQPRSQDQGKGPRSQDQGKGPRSQDKGKGPRSQDQGKGPRSQDQGKGPRSQDQGKGPHFQDQGKGPRSQDQGKGPRSQDQGKGLRSQDQGKGPGNEVECWED